jgi:LPS sulfotransferase NodH
VSWATAVRTGEWATRIEVERAAPRPLVLDVQEIAWFIAKTQRSIKTWRKIANASGTPTLVLTYEDHILSNNLQQLFSFLGLDPKPGIGFRTRKLSQPDYAHIHNADQINALLGNEATGYLFKPETGMRSMIS